MRRRMMSMSLRSFWSAVCWAVTTLEVGVDAADVAIVEDFLRTLGGDCGLVLLLGFLCKDAQGGKVIFNLLKGGEGQSACNRRWIAQRLRWTGRSGRGAGRHRRCCSSARGRWRRRCWRWRKSCRGPVFSKPAEPEMPMVGKKAARAIPMRWFASAARRSAAAISGRRSNNCEGRPGGMTGGCASSGVTGSEKLLGGCPIRMAMACS